MVLSIICGHSVDIFSFCRIYFHKSVCYTENDEICDTLQQEENLMKSASTRRIHLLYDIVISLSIIAVGICFIAQCIGIYRSGGEQIYTAEKVALAFLPIAKPVYLCLFLIFFGFILDLVWPRDKKKLKPEKNYAAQLQRLLEKRDVDSADPAVKAEILYQRKLRKQDRFLSLLLLAAGSIGFLIYGTNPANFHQTEINASMAKAVILLFCYLAVPFGFALGAAYRRKHSLQKEIELVKQLPAGELRPAAPAKSCGCKKFPVRWVVLGLALLLLVYGFCTGGTADVLTKAINICTECVGLG